MEKNRLVALNEAEQILAPFFPGCRFSASMNVSVNDVLNAGCSGAQLFWERSSKGVEIATLSFPCGFELGDLDRVFVHGSFPEEIQIILTAVVDGSVQECFAVRTELSEENEFEGSLNGRVLDKLNLRFVCGGDGEERQEAGLLMVGLADSRAREKMLARTYPVDWFGMIGEPSSGIVPSMGVWFDENELETMRDAAAEQPLKGLLDSLRKQARAAMREIEPERMVCNSQTRGRIPRHMHTRPREWEQWRGLVASARLSSFVGIMDRDGEMLRFAARCAIALCHRPVWGAFYAAFPGRMPDNHALAQMAATMACLETLDWAGCMLSDAGRKKIWDTVLHNGLSQLLKCQSFEDWVYESNHGIYYLTALVSAAIALGRAARHGEWLLPVVEKMLSQTLDRCWLEDGGGKESPAYLPVMGLLGVYLIARHRKLSVDDYVRLAGIPAKVLKCGDFCLAMMSDSRDASRWGVLTIGDSGWEAEGDFKPEPWALLHLVTGRREFGDVCMMRLLNGRDYRLESLSPGIQILFRVTGQGKPELPRPPVFARFPQAGHLTSCRKGRHGNVRLNLVGCCANPGHAHEDRGSLIVEVNGKPALIDPGITAYHKPEVKLLRRADRHNLLLPLDETGKPLSQSGSIDVPIIPEGKGDDKTLYAAIDLVPVWGGLFNCCRREIESVDPDVIHVRDIAESTAPVAVVQQWQSLVPIVESANNAWHIDLDGLLLRMAPDANCVSGEVDTRTRDHMGRTVYRLRFCFPESRSHTIVTKMTVSNASVPAK